jgi:hypothetical protein
LAIGDFYSGSLDDIAVGEPFYDPPGGGFNMIGRVNLFDGDAIDNNGASSDSPTNYIDNPQGAPQGDFDQFGYSIAAGDFNPYATTSDFDDLIVGEYRNDESANDAGRAYIFTCDDDPAGWQTNNPTPTDIANPEGSNGDGDLFGYDVGAGDVYSDGIEDFFIGAPYSGNSGPENGTIYIYDCDGSSIPTTYTDSQNGTSGGERLGWSVSGGKYSNDTVYVLVAGAPYWDDNSPSYDNAGRVWVMPIPEFQDIALPIGMIITIFVLFRKRSTRKKRN